MTRCPAERSQALGDEIGHVPHRRWTPESPAPKVEFTKWGLSKISPSKVLSQGPADRQRRLNKMGTLKDLLDHKVDVLATSR